jgi:hypothetical protein
LNKFGGTLRVNVACGELQGNIIDYTAHISTKVLIQEKLVPL